MRYGSRSLALALLLLLAIGLTACGGGDEASSTNGTTASQASSAEQKGGEASIEEFGSEAEGSDRDQILAAFTGYMSSIAEKDDEAACARLSEAVQGSLEQLAAEKISGGCAAILSKFLAATAPQVFRAQVNGKITKVRVEGDRAFVVFEAPGAKLYQMTMVKEGGEWKAATVTASILVPDLSEVTR
jgi:hypothetical protein